MDEEAGNLRKSYQILIIPNGSGLTLTDNGTAQYICRHQKDPIKIISSY